MIGFTSFDNIDTDKKYLNNESYISLSQISNKHLTYLYNHIILIYKQCMVQIETTKVKLKKIKHLIKPSSTQKPN
jgi:hypothetical protein